MRNPSPTEAEVSVPFDQTVWYRGEFDKPFHMRVIYPYQAELPLMFMSGRLIKVTIPAYTLMTFQILPGAASTVAFVQLAAPPEVKLERNAVHFTLPDEPMQRAEILLIAKGQTVTGAKTAALPGCKLNGEPATLTRAAAAAGWSIASVDLRMYRGQSVAIEVTSPDTQAHLLLDRLVQEPAADPDPRLPLPISQGYRRQSVQLSK